MKNINLGDEVRDVVTGFQGIAVARTAYLHGIDQIGVQPPCDKDGKIPESFNIDESSLKLIFSQRIKGGAATDDSQISVELGDRVKDPVSGLEGVVTKFTRFLNGCSVLGVNSGLDDKGNPRETFYFPGPRLEKLEEAVHPKSESKAGGPMTRMPKMR